MRTNLAADPAVKALVRALKLDAFSIVGRLHALWAWADEHSEDGTLPYITSEDIDDLTGKRGFAAQLQNIGWLRQEPQGFALPHFDRHNGSSAKRRATETERKRSGRNADNPPPDDALLSAKCPQTSGQRAPESGTREEKRREEKIRSETIPFAPAAAGADGIFKNDPQRQARFAALAEIDNAVIAELTPAGQSALNKALGDIVKASPNVTPEEIARRHKILRRMYPNASMSAMALAKHWARCASMPLDPNSWAAAQKRELAAEAAAQEKAEAEAKAQRTAEAQAGMAMFDNVLPPGWGKPTELTKP